MLLQRAVTEIEGVRPPIITIEIFTKLDEMRAYRHKFRNIYLYLIAPARIIELANEGIALVEKFNTEIYEFCSFLKKN
ncbi:MAG TPA: hypothetical protein PK348_07120 [Spirochaetota bacterium]|nr:hypothetical protein [Spirochaetota bacterium]HXK66021.1 hypothetical protein [Spirochaetota bacterium]